MERHSRDLGLFSLSPSHVNPEYNWEEFGLERRGRWRAKLHGANICDLISRGNSAAGETEGSVLTAWAAFCSYFFC